MSEMKSAILTQTDFLLLPLVSVVLFTAIFLGAVAWILRPEAREVYARRSRMPLDERDGEQSDETA